MVLWYNVGKRPNVGEADDSRGARMVRSRVSTVERAKRLGIRGRNERRR